MITIIYEWRLITGCGDQFVSAWQDITLELKKHGSLGSALFDGPDGTLFGIARWPNNQTRQRAFTSAPIHDASARMKNCVQESFAEKVLSDKLNLWS
jgi:hypothetical protein